MERFSLNKTEEMIEVLDPKVILFEGILTWERMKSHMGFHGECKARRPNARLCCVSKELEPKYVGIIHPSTHVSDENWEKVRSVLFPVLSTIE